MNWYKWSELGGYETEIDEVTNGSEYFYLVTFDLTVLIVKNKKFNVDDLMILFFITKEILMYGGSFSPLSGVWRSRSGVQIETGLISYILYTHNAFNST